MGLFYGCTRLFEAVQWNSVYICTTNLLLPWQRLSVFLLSSSALGSESQQQRTLESGRGITWGGSDFLLMAMQVFGDAGAQFQDLE